MPTQKIDLGCQFIEGWMIDGSICDELIDIHHNWPQTPGMVGDRRIDKDTKESMDVSIMPHEIPQSYHDVLKQCSDDYIELYPNAKANGFGVREGTQIQYYKPGGGFKVWHSERGITFPTITRHLVFMTYLNTLEQGGTEFLYQNYTSPAIKGLTLFWPSDWMFAHKSQVSHTEEKYIITGWMNLKGINR
jgi:hypothetical protein